MIHKIERLVSIGKYRNYQAAGQVNFHKLTLVYGDNGGGKTTLTSVFRSLVLNDPLILRNRISTNSTTNQAAQIVYRNGSDVNHTYHHTNGWTLPLPGIEIFDVHFVNENIYSGYSITENHKKQLHQFVVGAQGVAIQQQIETNKRAKTALRVRLSELGTRLLSEVGNGLTNDTIRDFIALPITEANDINTRITAAERSFANANANAVIQTLQNLSPLAVMQTGINFQDLANDLQTNVQAIQNRILQTLFENHCRELLDNALPNPEGWLRTGFGYIAAKSASGSELSCPFCKQTVNTSFEIISAYTSRFNEEFNRYIQRLQNHLQTVRNFNIEAIIQNLNNTNAGNTSRINSWVTHLPNTIIAPVYNVFTNEQDFRNQFQGLLNLLEAKIQNPSVSLNTEILESFRQTGTTINRNIVAYNQAVTLYNTGIATFRTGIQTVQQAQLELQRLIRIRRRFETEPNTICVSIQGEFENLRRLEAEYRTLTAQQQADVTTFFNNYKDKINYYLTDIFKTPFRIEDVRHIAPQGQAVQSKLGYKLTIDGQDISFDENQPLSTKECLSEGDKSTVALAFFLSKLELDANKANKILIFDDPLSSLDSKRRTYTVAIIRRLYQEMKQVIVLSHNEYFLHEISRNIGAQFLKTLRIVENFVSKESKLEVCDLDELAKSDYFKQIEALENFRSNPDLLIKDSVFGWLRTVLEAHIRFKFYREIRTMNGQKTFGSLIGHLDVSGAVFIDNANRGDIIQKLHMINNVSWMPHHGTPMPDFNTLGYNPNSITAGELDGLIVDTLDLINSRL